MTRAEALKALIAVESARWVPGPAGEPSFHEASRALQDAALVGRVPRPILREYLELAQAALWMSMSAYEEDHGDEPAGGIEAKFSDAVYRAAQSVADVLWASGMTRWIVHRRSLREVRAALARVSSSEVVEAIERSRRVGV